MGALPGRRLLTSPPARLPPRLPVLDVTGLSGGPRAAVVRRVGRPVLVLGSTQPGEVADHAACRRSGVEVVRRRSGGGAVLLHPDDPSGPLWVDLWLPRADPLWSDDVVAAAGWVGETFGAALADLGAQAAVHHGRPLPGPGSDLACFAGLGPGEVTFDGRKAVGVAQWRGREGALFHCAAYRRWDPAGLAGLLRLEDGRRRELIAAWSAAATGLGALAQQLPAALTARLPPGPPWHVRREGAPPLEPPRD